MSEAVIAFGANLSDRMEALKAAIKALSLLPGTKIKKISRIYETEPVGYADQPDFLNGAVLVETNLSPHALLGACLGIEAALGRERGIKNGPRVIDLDIIIYDGVKSDSFELTLPHPRAAERAFVLYPLHDLYPDGRAPTFYFDRHYKSVDASGIRVAGAESDNLSDAEHNM